MAEIVPHLGCPCGGRVLMHTGFKRGAYAFAKCEGCGKQTTWWGVRHRAEEAWLAGKFSPADYRAET